SQKVDPRVQIAIGFALSAVGFAMNAVLTADTAFWELFLPQAVRGVGMMFCIAPINTGITNRGAVHLARLSDHLSMARPQVQRFMDMTDSRLSAQITGDST